MIYGRIDDHGRALISVKLKGASEETPTTLEAWIDTGFTGELLVPSSLVRKLGCLQTSIVEAALADGSRRKVATYSCDIEWLGEERQIELIANDGSFPLLGVGLLLGHQLTLDYSQMSLSLQ